MRKNRNLAKKSLTECRWDLDRALRVQHLRIRGGAATRESTLERKEGDRALEGASLVLAGASEPGPGRVDGLLWGGVGLYIVCQTVFSVMLKLQGTMRIPSCPGCAPSRFSAVYTQSFIGNLSELVALPVFLLLEARRPNGSHAAWRAIEARLGFVPSREQLGPGPWQQPQCAGFVWAAARLDPPPGDEPVPPGAAPPLPRAPFYYWMIPAWIGLLGSVCRNIAVLHMSVSIQQMLSGLLLPTIAGLSVWCLKKRLLVVPHLLGVVLVLAGYVLVVLAELGGVGASGQAGLGLVLTVVQVVLYAINNIAHEYMLTHYSANPIEIMSLDSLGSFVLLLLLLPLLDATGLEDVLGAFYQIFHSTEMLIIICTYVLSHSMAQLMQYVIIGRGSALLFNIVIQVQGGVLWLTELLLQWSAFLLLQLVGYLAIFLGTLVYTNLFRIRDCLRLRPSLERIQMHEQARLDRLHWARYRAGDGHSVFSAEFWWDCLRCPQAASGFDPATREPERCRSG